MSSKKLKKTAAIDDASLNLLIVLLAACILIVAVTAAYFIVTKTANSGRVEHSGDGSGNSDVPAGVTGNYPFKEDISLNISNDTANAEGITGIDASNAVLIDVTTGEIIAAKGSGVEMHPASMTKVMTLIVVAENLKSEASLNDKLAITQEHINFKIQNKLSGELKAGEYTVNDLIHHMILKSDGVAAIVLSEYIAGSQANFVKLMNDKAQELNLEKTSFQNVDGSHEKYHLSTCRDIAKIMAYAMQNNFCASILSCQKYQPVLCYHSLLVSLLHNDQPSLKEEMKNVNILAGKTGWTDSISKGESGGCLVTYAKGNNGHFYVAVVAGTSGSSYPVAMTNAVSDLKIIFKTYAE